MEKPEHEKIDRRKATQSLLLEMHDDVKEIKEILNGTMCKKGLVISVKEIEEKNIIYDSLLFGKNLSGGLITDIESTKKSMRIITWAVGIVSSVLGIFTLFSKKI